MHDIPSPIQSKSSFLMGEGSKGSILVDLIKTRQQGVGKSYIFTYPQVKQNIILTPFTNNLFPCRNNLGLFYIVTLRGRKFNQTWTSDLQLSVPVIVSVLRHTTFGLVEQSVGVHDRSFRSAFILQWTSITRFKLPIEPWNVREPEIWSINSAVRLLQSLCIVNAPEFRYCHTVPKSDPK